MANKSYNLEKGFLVLYDWLPLLRLLSAEDYRAVVDALIDLQQNQTPLPVFENPTANAIAKSCESTILRRLDGQRGGKEARKTESTKPPTIPPSPTPLHPPSEVKISEVKLSEAKRTTRTKCASPPTGSDVYAERFAGFWKAYPKKVGKEAARRAFMKVKPSADLLQRMLTAIQEQKQADQWRKDNGQFIPNPATWLNQGRWEDEVTETASPQANILDQNNILEVLTK